MRKIAAEMNAKRQRMKLTAAMHRDEMTR